MFKHLPRPSRDLRCRATSADQGSEETSSAFCPPPPDADAGTITHYLYGTPALLCDQREDPPVPCALPSGPPAGLSRLPQNWLARFRTPPTAWKDHPHHPSGSKPRFAGAALTNTTTHVRFALALGTISLLAFMILACGNEGNQAPSEQSPQAEQSDQNAPSGTRALNSPNPETTTAVATSSQANAVSQRDTSSGTGSTSATPTPASREAEATEPTEVATTGKQAQEALDHYEVAKYYLQQRRYHQALHSLDQAVASNPGLAEAYTLRGLAHIALHDHEAALDDLNRAVDMEAGDVSAALSLRSYAHSELGNYDQAIEDGTNAQLAPSPAQDVASREDAALALFVAHYRKGDYGARAIQGYDQDTSYRSGTETYGLSRIFYQVGNLRQSLDKLQEMDASLLLKPDDAELHHRRGTLHRGMRWLAEATEDYSKALELYGNDAPERLYIDLAETYLELGEHEKVIQTLSQVDPSSNAVASAMLAYSYLRLDQPEDAKRSIDAIDYGFDAPGVRGLSGREAWLEDLRHAQWGAQYFYVTHFVMKGAVLAANGDYDEGAKYLNILECASKPWQDTRSDDIPTDIRRQRGQILDDYSRDDDYSRQATASAQQEISDWCGYPSELTADSEAAIWATVINSYLENSFLYLGIASVHSLDPFLIAADQPGLLLFIAKRYGTEPGLSLEVENAVERSIELDPGIPDAHRIMAELYLTSFPTVPQSLRSTRSQVLAERYERAVAAWEKYVGLADAEPEGVADYHFARGAVLGELGRKDEAQTAYQKAFELGYDEEAVKQALVELNQ